MEGRFRDAIMNIANNSANRLRLTDRHKTLIEQTLIQFVAECHTPDHPPYAAMILRAIEELKEKRGSSEESISKYIKNEYKDLPWAHYTLLKHHLGKLCDAGEVMVSNKGFYSLAGANCTLSKSSGPEKKLKRKRSSASGKMKIKRLKKDKTRENNQGKEVTEGKHPSNGKYHEEIERLNEIIEREAEIIKEDSRLAKLPIEMIDKHVEDDQQHREAPDYEVNDQETEMIEGQQNKEIENIHPGSLQMCGEVTCDDNDGENTFKDHSRVLRSGSHRYFFIKKNEFRMESEKKKKMGPGFCTDLKELDPEMKPNVSDSEGHIGLELVSIEQDKILHQPDLLTPPKRKESKQKKDPEGSNQIRGQRSKLRSCKRENTLEEIENKEADSKDTRKESSNNTLVQCSKLRSWKKQNQSEKNTDTSPVSLPLASPCRQKLKIEKPGKGKRGRPAKVGRRKLKLLKNIGKPDA